MKDFKEIARPTVMGGTNDTLVWTPARLAGAGYEIVWVEHEHLFVAHTKVADAYTWLEFGVFKFCVQEHVLIELAEFELLFAGEGPVGLRELRHSYWGKDGYIFYPSSNDIAKAFRVLERWFDVG